MENYAKAYREVLEILKYIPKTDFDKIPKDLIKMFEEKMDKEYDFKIDESKEFKEQILLKESKAILANIFLDYWVTKEKKEKIESIYKEVMNENELEKIKKYNPDELFKKKNNNKKLDENAEEKEVTVYKEMKWYNRFLDFIKSIFNKK